MSARVFLFLGAATIPACLGLLQDGFFSSSDGMIHLYRLFELDRALHAGILYPRWFPLSGYGYGLPVLNYYPPLAYYLAEVFHLFGAGYIVSTKLLVAAGFILAALSMFLFARDLLGAAPALIAGIAYAYLPYLLSDAYVRGNFPEFLAMSLIPLALYAFRRLFATQEQKFFVLAAISFAAIVLSHHLTAMLFAPLAAAYVLFLFATQRDGKRVLACIGAMFAALALSAFYWVPAIAELNLVFVDPASLPRFLVSRLVSAADFFAPSFAYTYLPQSEALLHSAGFPQTVVALFAIVVLSAAKQALPAFSKGREGVESIAMGAHIVFFFLLLILSIFMMLNWSAPLWYAVPTLRFMQFPWRWQVLGGVSIAFLIGVSATQIQRTTSHQLRLVCYPLLSLAIIALAIINLPVRAFPLTDPQIDLQHATDPDYVVAQMGWSWTREFVPAAVQEETVIGQNTRSGALNALRAVPSVRIENDGLLSSTMRVSSEQPFDLALHTFFYPGWQAFVDNSPAATYPSGTLGLATVNVPAGDHTVAFRFEETPFRIATDIVSVLALLAGVVWVASRHRRASIALGVATIVVAAMFFVHTSSAAASSQPIAVDVNFENRALLIGYSTESANNAAYVTLYWLALAEMDRDYISFVHLVGANSETVAQNDSVTDQGVTPTTRWQVGEIITDHHALAFTPGIRGDYTLSAGMYLPRENGYTNLIASDRAGNQIGNQVELGRIQLGK